MFQKVLVIDDAEDIHLLLGVCLRRERLTVVHCTSGDAGFEEAVRDPPDLVLLDVDMPTASGFEVCRRLKADPRTQPIPVIFLTGANALYSKIEGFDLGAVDYVTKPFDLDELRARVRAALRTKRERDDLALHANVDPLTGIGNRRAFERALDLRVASAQATGEPFALALIDIDHFKSINDRHGHPFGDRVIQTTAAILEASSRDGDGPFRIGGEEFAVLLPDTTVDGALTFAERVRSRIESVDVSQEGSPVRFTASLGVAAVTCSSRAACIRSAIVAAADGALYAAKRSGRNQVARAA